MSESKDIERIQELEAKAAEAEAKAAEARAEQDTISARIWDRRAKREQDWDARLVEAYDDRPLERGVRRLQEEAREAFLATPHVAALVAEQAEAIYRYLLYVQVQGLTDNALQAAPYPDRIFEGRLGDWLENEARRLADERLEALLSEREAYIGGKQVPAPLAQG